MHAKTAELRAAMDHIRAAPPDNAPIAMLCRRPDFGKRDFVQSLDMTVTGGIPGERWATSPWITRPDGSPDPRIQVSILPTRVMETVWLDRETQPHPGDPIVADLDCSYSNLPVGSHLQAGTAILEVSDVFNDACIKWKARYGAPAKDWIMDRQNIHLRLRGLLCKIVQDGTVTLQDRLIKL
ncbi:hypothetical protein ACSSNL_16185 [Thalassobius sp. S69A]|uniref:hypothetical protein n=1 Tax=unclassified Thalassovita TaxID=2619711 RepID=UPI000C0D15C2|nr:hypothetical protein [Paracoccaceae bacterium]MBT25608.1 hypothetical protein [Paracoccaceae bacterium]